MTALESTTNFSKGTIKCELSYHTVLPISHNPPGTNKNTFKKKNVNLPSPGTLDDACSLVSPPAMLLVVLPVCAC